MTMFSMARPMGVPVSNFSCVELKGHLIPSEQIDEPGKIQHGTADAIQPVGDNPLHAALPDVRQKLLKRRAVDVAAAEAPVGVNPVPAFRRHLPDAERHLRLNGDAVFFVHGLPGVNCNQARSSVPRGSSAPARIRAISPAIRRSSSSFTAGSGNLFRTLRAGFVLLRPMPSPRVSVCCRDR
jgi:hypothetical protein